MSICYDCRFYDETNIRQCRVYNNDCEPNEDATHCCEFIPRGDDMMLYWDSGNGKVTKTNENGEIPIFKGEEGIWIETWWVDKEKNQVISFAYTQETKDNNRVYLEREAHFERHRVEPRFLKSITIPKSKYKEAEAELNH